MIDWKSQLDATHQQESIVQDSTTQNWRQIFNYNELNETNQNSTLWNELHRQWWPTENTTDDLSKLSLE